VIHKFSIEVDLNPINDKIIEKVHFKTGQLLGKYFDEIDFLM
jgi:hypothetical protein